LIKISSLDLTQRNVLQRIAITLITIRMKPLQAKQCVFRLSNTSISSIEESKILLQF